MIRGGRFGRPPPQSSAARLGQIDFYCYRAVAQNSWGGISSPKGDTHRPCPPVSLYRSPITNCGILGSRIHFVARLNVVAFFVCQSLVTKTR